MGFLPDLPFRYPSAFCSPCVAFRNVSAAYFSAPVQRAICTALRASYSSSGVGLSGRGGRFGEGLRFGFYGLFCTTFYSDPPPSVVPLLSFLPSFSITTPSR